MQIQAEEQRQHRTDDKTRQRDAEHGDTANCVINRMIATKCCEGAERHAGQNGEQHGAGAERETYGQS